MVSWPNAVVLARGHLLLVVMTGSSIRETRRRISGGVLEINSLIGEALSRANSNQSENSYISVDELDVQRQIADLASGPGGLLRGIPISVKDCFDIRGYRTSVGARYYFETGGRKEQDAGLVERLRAAGAIITGKTHLQQLAYGLTGENRDFGNCLQVDRPNQLTGGSSSGAAASILEGSAMAAIGTDTGGSIRFPASLCSLFGYRASHGIGSWRGGHHLAESFDTIGFLFCRLEDAQLLGNAILGIPIGKHRRDRPIRIGVVNPDFCHDAEPEIVNGMRLWQERFKGCECEIFDATLWNESLEIYRPIQAHEAAGYHAGHFDEFEAPIADRLRWGASLRDEEVEALRGRCAAFGKATAKLFQRFDFLLLPVAPVSQLINGEDTAPLRDPVLRYTTPASLCGVPCLALPNEKGGCQLLARKGGDAELLAFAEGLCTAEKP
jgi:Asp-tRNA(Asn)/Glu-tRNA(Gln) amidotransferase A subunit family amidase